jgi:hypothetical protein
MRRLLLFAALLVALLAIYALRPGWLARAERRGVEVTEERGGAEASRAGASESGASAPAGGAEAEEARARVHGVVTGPEGPLWCARVVAYRSDTDDLLAEAFTNPQGRYTLPVEVSDFQLAVEPAAGVWLVPTPRRGIVLNAGDDLEQNFALAATANLSGRVVDKEGKGFPDVLVLAVRPEDAGPPDAHPNAVAGKVVAKSRSGVDGGFRLGPLAAGAYRLEIALPSLMLTAPVVAATGGPDSVLTVVHAIAADLVVEDIETGNPVDAFSVKLTSEGRVILEGRGSRGVFSRRVQVDTPLAPHVWAEVEVTAPGYTTWGPWQIGHRVKPTVRLVPRRDPNTLIRVSFDDGRPYRGAILLLFGKDAWSPRGPRQFDAGEALPLDRVEDGVYRGTMPLGRWWVAAMLQDVLDAPSLVREIDVVAGRDAEARFVLRTGGELVLMPARGAPACRVLIQGERGSDGGVPRGVFDIPAEGRRIEGIPPGLYKLGYPRWVFAAETAKAAGVATETIVWFRDVHVAAGRSEEIALPPP